MTVNSLIAIVDLKEPNSITTNEKIAWLSDLDGKIFEEVIKTHAGYDPETDTFTPYSEGTEDLLIGDPYAQGIYVNYLIAMIADSNAEAARYNKQMALYNANFSQWWNRYNATHMPISGRRFRF